MKTKDYYIKELNSLRVDGAKFAKANPGLSSYLAKEGQDPDVERMLEGFAFLTGKLHQKFDEELPEVAHNLVQLLWPNYIRPIPSYAIIQFDALKDDLKNQEVPKGLQILSKAASNGVVCKFQTCFKTKVMPLKLDNVEYLTYGQKATIELDLKMSASGNLSEISFETLRLFLGGSKFMAKELYLYLSRYIESIEVIIKDKKKKEINKIFLPKKSVSAVGFNASETIVPHPKNTFDGYVMMQEYFCFGDKHLFLDIENLKQIERISGDSLSKSNHFSLKFHFSKRLSTAQLPTSEDFYLFCTPVINLFESDAVPIRKTEVEDEYILTAAELKKDQSEVFSVENVRGWIPSKNIYQDYYPFESFGHISDEGEYYSERIKLSEMKDRTDTFLRFASSGGIFDDLEHNTATISVRMMCTNKDIPSTLHLDSLCVNDPISSSDLSFHNITIPSISYPPPIGGDFLWKLISNMSLNYLSLENISTLKMILQTYDFFGANDMKQKEKTDIILSGLVSISNKRTQMIYEGLPIRGIETELYLDPTKFTGIGEAYHLCCILNEFFSLYCSVNSFHRLIVHIENHETFSWPAKMGNQDLV
ncbi:type VI secretion system baseplate subunit TssF [Sulfurimonas sp.]|uniref:type VI secretion system baseplate subunit TssF n=1 Tax=Sulfurimonas sp. TaxID=2022749 RepID=UPI002B4A26B4|nr:type VI secretion system baseplate subunit TssF [Sulfurimonas sp.]